MARAGWLSVRHVFAVFPVSLLGFVFSGSVGDARAGDLVDHNGFEACWSQAITQSQFLGQLKTSIDGTTTCIAQSSGLITGGTYSACNMTACPGNATGCPVTLRADAFGGAFANATSTFSASGSADDISVDVSYTVFTVPGSCTITLSNIGLGYSLDYSLQADGNNGLYAGSLNQTIVTINNGYTVVGSNATCDLIASTFASLVVSDAETAASNLVAALEEPATVGESVCPLTP